MRATSKRYVVVNDEIDELGEQPVEVGVRRAFDIQLPAAHVAERCPVIVRVTSVCSSTACTHKTVLCGSPTAVAI